MNVFLVISSLTLGLRLALGNYITQKALLHELRLRWPMEKLEMDASAHDAPRRGGTSGIAREADILTVPGSAALCRNRRDWRESVVPTAQSRV